LKNLENNEAPTEDADTQWDRMERNSTRKELEAEERRQRKLLE
jgi:hypothetical protein